LVGTQVEHVPIAKDGRRFGNLHRTSLLLRRRRQRDVSLQYAREPLRLLFRKRPQGTQQLGKADEIKARARRMGDAPIQREIRCVAAEYVGVQEGKVQSIAVA
jgi:hypothetical protein